MGARTKNAPCCMHRSGDAKIHAPDHGIAIAGGGGLRRAFLPDACMYLQPRYLDASRQPNMACTMTKEPRSRAFKTMKIINIVKKICTIDTYKRRSNTEKDTNAESTLLTISRVVRALLGRLIALIGPPARACVRKP